MSSLQKIKSLYEDKDVLILDKPAGLLTHKAGPRDKRPALTDWLIKKRPSIQGVGENPLRPGIVHRLDKETSGLIIIAKNQKSFNYLKGLFKRREVEKRYLALVYGKTPQKGKIEKALGRSKKDKFKFLATNDGAVKKAKQALTFFKAKKCFDNQYTLLELCPATGRTHQIRVHLASEGYPIVGDKKYFHKHQKDTLNIPRMFLHAWKIKLTLPSGKAIKIQSDLPKNLSRILKKLEK